MFYEKKYISKSNFAALAVFYLHFVVFSSALFRCLQSENVLKVFNFFRRVQELIIEHNEIRLPDLDRAVVSKSE